MNERRINQIETKQVKVNLILFWLTIPQKKKEKATQTQQQQQQQPLRDSKVTMEGNKE